MKQIALLLFALTAWGQSPPTTTVADTIYTGLNNGTISGRLQITSPERTYDGQTLILPPQSIPIVNGAFSVALVPNDITLPASTYTVEVYASYSPRPIMAYSWYVTTSASALKLTDVIQRRTVAPPDFPMLSLFQIAIGGAAIDDCIGNDGVKAVWKTCGTGGGTASWSGLAGSPTDNTSLMGLLAGKASTAHASTHASAGSDPLTLDLSQVSGLISAMAGKVDGLSSVTDGQFLQFDGTGGKTIKASTLTGVLKASSGVPSVVTGTSTDCVKVDGTSGSCAQYTPGVGLGIVSTTISLDLATAMIHSTTSGPPSYSSAAGSELIIDSVSGFPYLSNGTTSPYLMYRAGVPIQNADIPAATSSALGGSKDYTCAAGQHAQSMASGVTTCAADTGTTGGSTTGLYTGTLDFGAIPDGACAGLTFTATGIVANKTLALSVPAAWDTGLTAIAFASAADTVKVRACNFSGAAVDPASGTFSVRDLDSLGYLTASATIDFSAIPDGNCAASTVTLTGAAGGDNVAPGWPAALETGLTGAMFVSAADTVSVRVCNWSGSAVDPASGSFKAAITR